MRVFKYLIGLWAAIAVYSIFSIASGPRGLSAYSQLLAEKERQMANLNELSVVNEELEKTANSLRYDDDTLLVYARQLGYGREYEQHVRIVGLGGIQNSNITPGKVYYAAPAEHISDRIIKITAFSTGLILFAFFFVLELIQSKER